MSEDQDDVVTEQSDNERRLGIDIRQHAGGLVLTGDNNRIVQLGSGAFHAAPPPPTREDPRQVFLAEVRALALKEASRFSLLSLIFMAAGATILLCGGVLALMRHGPSAGPSAALMTSLGGVLIGTCGGALALQSKRSQRRLTAEADRVAKELLQDHTREEVLALIDRIDDAALRDRLRSITAMEILGLSPAPEDVASRVFPAASSTPPEISPPSSDQ
ncbi:hypothetical protein ACIPLC_37610 [Kitasatospora sp. NPDC086801]|uniref:TRADD-N-associated membrane domain-containing protein n=1 Tax=Kitasatospora sp. NPDC086801 TaxID=3364066 RepID=UPI003807C5A2